MLLTVSVRVRIAISKVHFIIVMFKLNFKGKCIIRTRSTPIDSRYRPIIELSEFILGYIVLIISNILPRPDPSGIPLLSLSLGVSEGLHSVVEGGVGLHEVYNVELVLAEPLCIRYFEVEPLGEIVCRVVVLQS